MKNLSIILSILFLFSTLVIAHDSASPNVKVLVKSSKSWDGQELPNYETGKPEITVLKITIPPHSELPVHKHPIINVGILTKGKLTVMTNENETLYLEEGSPIIEVVDKWHFGKNESDEPAEIIVFYAGVKEKPLSEYSKVKIEELEAH